MPPVQSVPSVEVDDDVAFKIINQDDLPMNIVGESIFKPFDYSHKDKPNVMVHPIRRMPNHSKEENHKIAPSDVFWASNNAQNLYDLQTEKSFEKTFTKILDSKLRKLQQEGSKKSEDVVRKPLFVTTVKKGQFLEPPPEIAVLLGIKVNDVERNEKKKLYAYVSKPKVLHKNGVRPKRDVSGFNSKTTPREDAKSNVNKKNSDVPTQYGNVMFDRRVVRGSNYATCLMQTQKWNPNFANAKLLSQNPGDGESAAARAAEARRRALARRKAQKQKIRGMDLRIGSPPAVQGRLHERVQTDSYLEELWLHPQAVDQCTQTDLFLDRPVSPLYVPAKIGVDVETQIWPGDLFDFDMEVQPILEVLVGKTIEQALIEVLEEEELAALREQQRRFLEMRAVETADAQNMAERERRLQAEKEKAIAAYEKGLQIQKEMEERIAASVLMQGYMADLLPSVLEGLDEEGFLSDNIKQDIDEGFIPWLMREVTHEMQEMVASRDILTDMVREILENRAEIYKALNRTPREESDQEEENTTMVPIEDIPLTEHVKLKKEIGMAEGEEKRLM